MSTEQRKPRGDKAFAGHASELVGLVIAYAKQETVAPIKALGRFLIFGISGAFLIAIGGGMLALAAVRAVQAEAGPHMHGPFHAWVPYVAGILLAGGGAAWALSRIGKGLR